MKEAILKSNGAYNGSCPGSFDLKQFSSSSLVIRGFLLEVCFIFWADLSREYLARFSRGLGCVGR